MGGFAADSVDVASDASPDVLIVSYRRADLVQRCLESVRAHLPRSRVYVWDNLSDQSEDVAALATSWPGVSWTFHDANIGFAAAVNRLVRMSTSPQFFLLNPDAEMTGDLTRTRAALRDPGVAAAAPWVEDPRHHPWDNAHREPTLVRSLVSYAGWDDRVGRRPALSMAYRRQPAQVTGYLTGAGLLLSREAWHRVGEFDERFFLYGEEADWCRRARRAGYRLMAVSEPGIRHTAAGTVSDVASGTSTSARLLQENRIRYLRLHHGRAASVTFDAGSRLLNRVQTSKRIASRVSSPTFIITSPTLDFGGAERQRVALANGLAAEGERVVLRLLQGEGELRRHVRPDVQVRLAHFGVVERDAGPRTLLVTGTTRIELAHGAAWRAANFPRGRWVVANHHYASPDRPVFGRPEAALMRRSDGVVYLADKHRSDHLSQQRLDIGRYWVVPNGIDVDRFSPSPVRSPAVPRLVSIGRLAESKQIPLLVEALASIEDVPWEFDIWGDGPARHLVQAAIPDHLAHRIRLRGWCTDVAAALAEADLFCMSSRFEAQPMVVLEAMAAGVPVMSSAVASVPEMLSGGAGVIVEPNTAVTWADRLRQTLSDPSQLDAIRDEGRRRVVERYSEAAMIENYRTVRGEVFAR